MINRIPYYYSNFGVSGILSALKSKLTKSNSFIKVKRRDIEFPFYLRTGSTDIAAFDQIFIHQEYAFNTLSAPSVIIDAGANVGLAAIYFTNRFPQAKIIAIEPELSNYEMLKKNVEPYGNIISLNAALWDKNEEIELVDPGLGKWGFMAQDQNDPNELIGSVSHKVQAMTVDKIIDHYNLEKVDILKIDIEGSEREVFKDTSAWINNVDALIVELHERLKVGCTLNFQNGAKGFDDEWKQGENIYLSRNKCLIKSFVS